MNDQGALQMWLAIAARRGLKMAAKSENSGCKKMRKDLAGTQKLA